MTLQRAVFTVTPGRTGTQWLAELFKQNATDVEVHHELLGPGHFGVNTPDLEQLTTFNEFGCTPQLREFWKRKFEQVVQSRHALYVETNHQLAKAGLIEHLDLCPCPVTLLFLQRDLAKILASLLRTGLFTNTIQVWLWTLSPDYALNLTDSERWGCSPGTPHDLMLGIWYVFEMYARMGMYATHLDAAGWFGAPERDRSFMVTASLEELVDPGHPACAGLLNRLGLSFQGRPEPQNNTLHDPNPAFDNLCEHAASQALEQFGNPWMLGAQASISAWALKHRVPFTSRQDAAP